MLNTRLIEKITLNYYIYYGTQKGFRNRKKESHVFRHCDQFRHQFDFDNVKNLARSNNYKTRRILEGIRTHVNRNSLNRAWEVNPIDIYNVLLKNNY